ncbi:MAG: helix-turn-helix transcriptional regulator [Cyanobacteriota bacterium]
MSSGIITIGSCNFTVERDQMSNIGERVREQRLKIGLSLDKLSKLSNVSKTYLSEIESGVKKNPSAGILLKIATALKVSIQYLMKGDNPDSTDTIPIPESLKEFAIEEDLRYSEVEQLFKMSGIAIAHRGKKVDGSQVSKEGWKKIYYALKGEGLI